MEDFEKAYRQLKLENQRLKTRLTLLECDASKNRYKALFQGSMEAVAISQGEWIVDANEAFLKLFGYDRLDECAAKPIIEHVARQSRPFVREKLDKAATGRTRPTRYEVSILRKDGAARNVEVMATEFACDGAKFIQSSFRDITERKQAEQQLVDRRTTLEAEVRRRTAQLEKEIRQHKLTEQKMDRERNLLRTLINNIPDEIYVKDTEGRFLICNEATMTGLDAATENDVIGRTDADFCASEKADIYRRDEQHVLRTGLAMVDKEESAMGRDGSRVWFRTTKAPLVDNEGRTIGLIGIGRNVTKEKQAEAALTEERNILRIMIDNLPDHLYVKDREHRFTTCNKAVIETDGFSPIGMTDFDIYPRHKAEVFHEEEERVMATGEPLYNKDEYAFHENGDLKQCCLVNKFPLRDAEGNITGMVGINHDITEIKRAERALEEERNVLRTLIDSMPARVYVKDANSRFTACNLAVEELHGCSPVGKTDFDLYPHDEAQRYYDEEQTIMRTGQALVNEEQYRFDESGEMVGCWLVTKVPLRDSNGAVYGIVGTNHVITDVKHVQQALAEERNVLRTLIDNLPQHIYVKDTESRFTTCNLAVEQAHGGSPIGQTDFDLYQQRKAEEFHAEEQQVIKTGQPLVNKEHYEYDDEGVMTCCWTVSKFPLRNTDGNVLGIVGINHDVTEEKNAQRALVEERNLLRTVIDNLPAHLYVKDFESRFTMCNSAVVDLYGYDPVGKTDFDLYPRNEAQRYYEDEQKVMRTAEALVGWEWCAFDDSGALKDCWSVNKFPLRDASGRISGIVGIDFDVTESKLAEQALRESEEQYRTLVENSLDGLAIVQGDTILFVNRQIVEMFGYQTPEEMCALIPWKVVAPEQREMIRQRAYARMAGHKVPDRYEFPAVRKDGTRFDVEMGATLVSHKGRPTVQVLMRDVTERNRLRRELAEYREKIVQAEKNAYVNSIGAAVAHQLNQPLTVINLLLEETLSELAVIPCPPAVKTHLADCLAESKNAGDIIARFRTCSKEPHFGVSTPVDVRQVLARIAAALSDNAARVKVKVTVDQTADVPPVEASAAALEQVAFLLIQNAIQAADGTSDHKLHIKVKPAGSAVKIEFADDCAGIPPENLDSIFEPFFTTKPPGQGTGLGLTIVRRILLAHGGKVTVRSRPGRGSTFTVTWPLKKDTQ